ncbi:MAG: hypothetical protein HZB11_01100 [Candidatus Yonathbacteria bacterium]|nr:hypothetical protein [Candidatus Yonathbacteria bacterium]
MMKKISTILVFLGLVIFIIFYFKNIIVNQRETIIGNQEKQIQGVCLGDDEMAENSAPGDEQGKWNRNMGYFATSPVTIFVKDKKPTMKNAIFRLMIILRGFIPCNYLNVIFM